MTDIAGRFRDLGDRRWFDVPPGYVFRWDGAGGGAAAAFDLLHRAEYNRYGPVWLVRCNKHWQYTPAATAQPEGNRLGTVAGRRNWCTGCAAEAG